MGPWVVGLRSHQQPFQWLTLRSYCLSVVPTVKMLWVHGPLIHRHKSPLQTILPHLCCCCSVAQARPTLRPHGLQHARPLCPSAVAAAKLLQSCPTLCDPIDGSPRGSPIPGILQARTLSLTISQMVRSSFLQWRHWPLSRFNCVWPTTVAISYGLMFIE